MFLTPCECAQIMSEIENKEVSVRKVYYLLESFEFQNNNTRIGGVL
ncbi:hypothetical protein [Treponema phagedenis]|nr:hypothetical protein [Treponema phagedenis]QKS91495.1 hypothetical protein HPJ96_02135 [Treponema phagedenis]